MKHLRIETRTPVMSRMEVFVTLVFALFFFNHNNVYRLTSYKDIKNILKIKVIKRDNTEHKTYVRHIPLLVNSAHRLNIKYIYKH